MAKENVAQSVLVQQYEQPLNLAAVQNQLVLAVDRLYDVDAALRVFKESLTDEAIELEDGTSIDPTRPVDMAIRELDAIREDVAAARVKVDLEIDAKTRAAREAFDAATAPTMRVTLDRDPRQFLIDDCGNLYLVEPDENSPGASKLTSIGEVSDELFAKLERMVSRRAKKKAA